MFERSVRSAVLSLALLGAVAPSLPGTGAAAEAASRTALILTEAAYPDDDDVLPTPVKDGASLAEALQGRGFAVQSQADASGAAAAEAVKRFLATVKPGSIALVFFSGLGIQVAGKNYLVPVDARIWSEADVLRVGLSVDQVIHDIADRGASADAVILDASRRNPFERRFRSVPAGLAPMAASPGTLSLSAAAAGALVDDAPGETGSIFMTQLVKALNTPGLDAEQAFSQTRDAVAGLTRDGETPSLVSGLDVPFSFDPGGRAVAVSKPVPPQPAAPPPAPKPPTPVAAQTAPAPPAVVEAAPAPPPAPKPPPAPAPPQQTASLPQADAEPSPPQSSPAPASTETPLSGAETARRAELTRRIARDPRDQEAFFERGRLLAQHGSYTLALLDLDRAVSLNPTDADAFNDRCWTRSMVNQLQTALDDCDQALKLRPAFADAHDSRGLVLMKRGTAEAAIADYDAAIRLDPKQSSALYGRGIAELRLGRREDAERDISSALALDPEVESEYARYGLK